MAGSRTPDLRLVFGRPPQVALPVSPSAAGEPYRPGDLDDFDRLYRASYSRVLFTLTALLRDRTAAEDCAQEAFVRAFRAWDRWRPEARAETWLQTIAINVAISYRRREGRPPVSEVLRRLGRARGAARDDGVDVVSALRRIPQEQAAAMVLRYHYGYTNREIGAALHVPESTIASRLATARRRLRAVLDDDEPEWDLTGRATRPANRGRRSA